MNEEHQTETAESSTAPIETASSPDEELQVTEPQVEITPEPETEELVLKRKTAERFDKLTSTVKNQQTTIDQLRQNQNQSLEYEDPGAPKADDFDDEFDYAAAKGAYDATKNMVSMFNQNRAQQAQAQQVATVNQQIQAHTGRVQNFLTENTDYQQVISGSMLNVMDSTGNLTVAAKAIIGEGNSPAIEYHLAKNPDIAMALNQAGEAQVGAIVARLSDHLNVSPAIGNQPPPPIGSEGSSTGVGEQPDDFARKYPDAEFL